MLRGSFVPPKESRELRDLTRYRTQVIRQRAQECNRIQKLSEDGNITLTQPPPGLLSGVVQHHSYTCSSAVLPSVPA